MTGTNHTVAGLTDGVEYTKEHLKDTRLEMPFLDFGWYPKTRVMFPLTHVIICAKLESVRERLILWTSIARETLTETFPLTMPA